MRLIDADKLKIKHFVQRGDQPIGYEGTQPVYDYTDLIAYDVDNAPTVKSIPIEWLKAYFKKCLSFDDRVFIDNEDSNYDIVIDKYKIFEEWEKENERV